MNAKKIFTYASKPSTPTLVPLQHHVRAVPLLVPRASSPRRSRSGLIVLVILVCDPKKISYSTNPQLFFPFSIMCGLTPSSSRAHLVRGALEAVSQQVAAAAAALAADGAPLARLLADGGMAQNGTMMQMAADVLGVPVVRIVFRFF